MIGAFRRRLHLAMRQPDDPRASSGGHDEALDLPEVEFVAYTGDGRLSGRLRLDTTRLSDMLNDHDELLLAEVLAERLPEGGTMVVPALLVQRDELILVHATGPRGDRRRRTRTEPCRLALRAGPYLVTGDVHAAQGVDPVVFFRRRRSMVPLTDATIEYRTVDGTIRELAGTIVVNRDQLDWITEVEDATGGLGLPGATRDEAGRFQR